MSPAPTILIIADDLTGALDSAAPFAQRGLRTRVLALPQASVEDGASALAGAEVVAVNTESRHLPAATAAQAVAQAVQRYARAGAVLFKKVDSTLRGNVAAETVAAQQASGRRLVVFAPAFPAQGRITREGVVYVHGAPLAQTEFVRDALSPAPREPIAQFMREAAPQWRIANLGAEALAVALAQAPGRTCLAIVDARQQDDLERAVSALHARLSECVLVGSAGLSSALVGAVAATPPVASRAAGAGAAAGITLFVVGSRAQKSREQAAVLRAAGAATLEAPNGSAGERALQAVLSAPPGQGSLMLLATQGSAAAAADVVACRLAQLSVRVMSRVPVRAVVATGGDTAKAILQLTHNPAVEVRGELLPGIAIARFAYLGREYDFVTKAGGFGSDDTFACIAQRLAASSSGK